MTEFVFLALQIGCAECRLQMANPLTEVVGTFDSLDAAQESFARTDEWLEAEPDRLWFRPRGSGDDMIVRIPQ